MSDVSGAVQQTHDFESDDRYEGFIADRIDGNNCCSHSYTIVSSNANDAPNARAGLKMARFELNSDDPNAPFSSKRAEMSWSGLSLGLGKILGGEEWYGISIYLPVGYVADTLSELPVQWHGRPDSGEVSRSPVLGFYISNGQWQIDKRHSDIKIQTSNPNPITMWSEPYENGVWTDFVVRVRWDYRTNGNGLTQVWMRTDAADPWRQVVDDTGPNSYNDDEDIYLKTGIYKWSWASQSPTPGITQRVLFIDEVNLGAANSSFDEVAAPDASTGGGVSSDCIRYPSNSTTVTGFGASYNVFSDSRELLMDATCDQSSFTLTIGNDLSSTHVYETGYLWDGSNWVSFTLTGENKTGVWFPRRATASLQYQGVDTYVLGYSCLYVDNVRKCGCADTSCANSTWQLQVLRRP